MDIVGKNIRRFPSPSNSLQGGLIIDRFFTRNLNVGLQTEGRGKDKNVYNDALLVISSLLIITL